MKGDGGGRAGWRAVPTIVKSIDAHLEAADDGLDGGRQRPTPRRQAG